MISALDLKLDYDGLLENELAGIFDDSFAELSIVGASKPFRRLLKDVARIHDALDFFGRWEQEHPCPEQVQNMYPANLAKAQQLLSVLANTDMWNPSGTELSGAAKLAKTLRRDLYLLEWAFFYYSGILAGTPVETHIRWPNSP